MKEQQWQLGYIYILVVPVKHMFLFFPPFFFFSFLLFCCFSFIKWEWRDDEPGGQYQESSVIAHSWLTGGLSQ